MIDPEGDGLFVNFPETRVTWEEGHSLEEWPPSDWRGAFDGDSSWLATEVVRPKTTKSAWVRN